MAGIEKVCEYSGEYGYGDMYSWKRNSIQIMPKFRKLFKGANAVLYIKKTPMDIWIKTRGCKYLSGGTDTWGLEKSSDKELKVALRVLFEERYWLKKQSDISFVKEYTYALKVDDKELQGKVDGLYINWSTDMPTVIRKMRRLVRDYNLKIVYLNDEDWEKL